MNGGTSWYQKAATAALVSVLVLILVGAIVRVTGAGLGCPDWPKCWGCLIPPWKVEQVDVSKIDFEKFQKKAERMGRDPSTVTPEHILENFNPVHTWTEFVNRLFSLPVGLFSVLTVALALGKGGRFSRWILPGSLAGLLLVLVNAVMGAWVVYSGLQPGILTLHMALAMALIALLAFLAWRGVERPWCLPASDEGLRKIRWAVLALFGLVLAEGILGSQVREMTDHLSKFHDRAPREEWIGELEQSWVYLLHRSFSWAILVATVAAWMVTKRETAGRPGRVARAVLAVVLVQMVLGVVMSQIRIFAVVQVLHVGLSGALVALGALWWCGTVRVREADEVRLAPGAGAA